ncbi:hypothetical protein MferCBS31731_007165 [Microsporum ferrugineum]
MLITFISLVATLTIWSTIASAPSTAVAPQDGFGRRLAGSIKASLMTIGAFEVTKRATKTAASTYCSYRRLGISDNLPDAPGRLPEISNRLPATYEEWLAIPPINYALLYDDLDEEVERPPTLNGRPFPWHLLKRQHYGTPCRAADPSPGATHTHRVDRISPDNSSEILLVCGYLGLILASLALGRCLGTRYLVPASAMDHGKLTLLPAGASPALPPRVVTGLRLELRTELVDGLPLMWDSQPYISSIPFYWIAEPETLHLLKPQPDYTTKRQTETRTGPQTQALVLRRLDNISPFVLIQIVRLLVSALESGNFGSQEPKPEPKLDLAAPLREPKKKRNRPGQKQRRRKWAKDNMIALQEKEPQESEGKSQS